MCLARVHANPDTDFSRKIMFNVNAGAGFVHFRSGICHYFQGSVQNSYTLFCKWTASNDLSPQWFEDCIESIELIES